MSKWPDQYTLKQAQAFLEDHAPRLIRRIEKLEAEVKRLEAEKQSRRGRKNAANTA